jgi:hypothetical protein
MHEERLEYPIKNLRWQILPTALNLIIIVIIVIIVNYGTNTNTTQGII